MNPAAFRFEDFADAASAQAAFEAAFPPGSPIEPALQALVDLGAQCKAATPTTVVCRYIETLPALAGFCWFVVLDYGAEKAIKRLHISSAMMGA